MKIAFFTSLSPIQSALSDYGEGLALAMSEIANVTVDVFIDDNYKPDNVILTQKLSVYTYHEFEARAQDYDIYLYSMGDHSGYYGYMFDFIYRYPGIVILNDLTLHRCILQFASTKKRMKFYLDELQYAYGIRDLHLASQIEAGLGDLLVLEYPMFEHIVDSSLGVIVQNRYAQDRILAKCSDAKVTCIPYPFFMPPGFPQDFDLAALRAQQRTKMELEGHFVVGSFGIFVPNKHLESCLRSFAHVAQKYPQAKYILVGSVVAGYDLMGYIADMGLTEQVLLTGWLSPVQFVRYMFALDVGIHLRYPHIGGTPYTPIRLMGLDVCTVVSDIEPLAEIPQGACIKIAPDDYQESTLLAMLDYLAEHPQFRQQVSANGYQFIDQYHNLTQIAQQSVAFMASV